MDWDDPKLKKTAAGALIGEPLEAFAIGELEVRLQVLEDEICRVKKELLKKKAHGAAASALFKS